MDKSNNNDITTQDQYCDYIDDEYSQKYSSGQNEQYSHHDSFNKSYNPHNSQGYHASHAPQASHDAQTRKYGQYGQYGQNNDNNKDYLGSSSNQNLSSDQSSYIKPSVGFPDVSNLQNEDIYQDDFQEKVFNGDDGADDIIHDIDEVDNINEEGDEGEEDEDAFLIAASAVFEDEDGNYCDRFGLAVNENGEYYEQQYALDYRSTNSGYKHGPYGLYEDSRPAWMRVDDDGDYDFDDDDIGLDADMDMDVEVDVGVDVGVDVDVNDTQKEITRIDNENRNSTTKTNDNVPNYDIGDIGDIDINIDDINLDFDSTGDSTSHDTSHTTPNTFSSSHDTSFNTSSMMSKTLDNSSITSPDMDTDVNVDIDVDIDDINLDLDIDLGKLQFMDTALNTDTDTDTNTDMNANTNLDAVHDTTTNTEYDVTDKKAFADDSSDVDLDMDLDMDIDMDLDIGINIDSISPNTNLRLGHDDILRDETSTSNIKDRTLDSITDDKDFLHNIHQFIDHDDQSDINAAKDVSDRDDDHEQEQEQKQKQEQLDDVDENISRDVAIETSLYSQNQNQNQNQNQSQNPYHSQRQGHPTYHNIHDPTDIHESNDDTSNNYYNNYNNYHDYTNVYQDNQDNQDIQDNSLNSHNSHHAPNSPIMNINFDTVPTFTPDENSNNNNNNNNNNNDNDSTYLDYSDYNADSFLQINIDRISSVNSATPSAASSTFISADEDEDADVDVDIDVDNKPNIDGIVMEKITNNTTMHHHHTNTLNAEEIHTHSHTRSHSHSHSPSSSIPSIIPLSTPKSPPRNSYTYLELCTDFFSFHSALSIPRPLITRVSRAVITILRDGYRFHDNASMISTLWKEIWNLEATFRFYVFFILENYNNYGVDDDTRGDGNGDSSYKYKYNLDGLEYLPEFQKDETITISSSLLSILRDYKSLIINCHLDEEIENIIKNTTSKTKTKTKTKTINNNNKTLSYIPQMSNMSLQLRVYLSWILHTGHFGASFGVSFIQRGITSSFQQIFPYLNLTDSQTKDYIELATTFQKSECLLLLMNDQDGVVSDTDSGAVKTTTNTGISNNTKKNTLVSKNTISPFSLQDSNGWTTFHQLIIEQKYTMFRQVLQLFVQTSKEKEKERSENTNVNINDDIIYSKATNPLNLQSNAGWTALYLAVHLDLPEYVDELLQAGADPSISTKIGMTPLNKAQKSNLSHIVNILETYLHVNGVEDGNGDVEEREDM